MASDLILICFALRDEAAPFLRSLKNRRAQKTAAPSLYRGEIATNDIAVALTGIGPAAAERSTRALLASLSPAAVISSGFAGALRANLKRGDIIIPELVTDEADTFACDASLLFHPSTFVLHPSKLVSVPRILTTSAEKRALHQRTGAAAVDMESASIARVCREKKIPFLVARIISDEVGEDLPVDFNALLGDNQQPAPAKAARYFLRHPAKLTATLKMQRQLAGCAKKLAQFLSDFLTKH